MQKLQVKFRWVKNASNQSQFFLLVHSWIKENTTEWALFNSKSSHFQCTLMSFSPAVLLVTSSNHSSPSLSVFHMIMGKPPACHCWPHSVHIADILNRRQAQSYCRQLPHRDPTTRMSQKPQDLVYIHTCSILHIKLFAFLIAWY